MSKKLVIVESPAKARTIGNYLGKEFTVEASVGHIRDLPQPSELPENMKKGDYGKFAVNINDGFKPYYVVSSDKKKKVTELKAALKEADELFLATDEDREGEAIAWHLLAVLKPKVPVKRMVFHEITKEAITRALANTREINQDLVDAQETRRILDRLVGYEVSPLLWRKVRRGLSAGRVQSVATRMVVERERERMSFIPAEYFDLSANFYPQHGAESEQFQARLIQFDQERLAQGRDFDDQGKVTRAVRVMDRQLCERLAHALTSATNCQVANVESKPYKRRPAAPFTTSTLQQEAGRKLKLPSRQTMQLAQYLYENGFITYMRTDSTALSEQAIQAARKQALQLYGVGAVPDTPRYYAKKAKGAQEAHEAIRPAGDNFRTPDQVAGLLNRQQLALYDLIWKRTVASQMVDALGTTDTVRVQAQVELADPGTPQLGVQVAAEATPGQHQVQFTASGTVINQRGFLAAYQESSDSERYRKDDDAQLPNLSTGQALTVAGVDLDNSQHMTSPPPRYTEASLVKTMEERGVGRPSTYASTIGVIVDRGYVHRRGQALVPSWLAFSVTRLLEDTLSSLVDYDFTALMEGTLDQIAAGDRDGKQWLHEFYFGLESVAQAQEYLDHFQGDARQAAENFWKFGFHSTVESLGDVDAREVNTIPLTGQVAVRVGRYGPYLEDAEGKRVSIPDDVAPDELTAEKIKFLYENSLDDGRELGVDPESGHKLVVKSGRYGPYVTEDLSEEEAAAGVKPRTASLFKSMNPMTVELETARQLLTLPREIGTNADGEVITAQNGPYGAYIKCGKENRSLTSEDQIFTVTLQEALDLLAQPKVRGRRAAKPPLAEFPADPESGKTVTIKEGRFGPYITDGVTNVTVPRGTLVESMTAEQAYELLAIKRAKGPSTRKSSTKKTSTRKTSAKKTTTKKAATKKATAKKTTAKK